MGTVLIGRTLRPEQQDGLPVLTIVEAEESLLVPILSGSSHKWQVLVCHSGVGASPGAEKVNGGHAIVA